MFPTAGKSAKQFHSQTALIDKSYMVMGNHLDETTIIKIKSGDYVDFSKLVPRDRVLAEEDQCLEMVLRGGRTFYVPVNDGLSISSFYKWEQAFRLYSYIYTKFYPQRSSELIEYNHIIHTIAQIYTWENVYMYNKDFRLHLAKHPSTVG